MNKRLFLFLALVSFCAVPSFAQISKGDPSAIVIKTGNRPGAGDFGLFLGAGYYINNKESYYLPVLNLKYFTSDNMELRIGVDVFRNGRKTKGSRIDGSVFSETPTTTEVKRGRADGFVHLQPGFAYHFSKSNILDVYLGAEIPFGIDSYSSSTATGTTFRNVSWNPFVIGANAIVGLQAFIGNLPLAIGLEYGIGGSFRLGDKYRVSESNGTQTVKYYTTSRDGGENYKSLGGVSSFIDQTARLTISYYFN